MNGSGRRSTLWLLPLFLLATACDDPVTVVVEAEPEEVDTCEWLIPIGIELVNDYFYTLEETDLGPAAINPAAMPESVIALNARGADLDQRAVELECNLEELNTAIAAATEGLESTDPVANVFLDTVRGGIGTTASAYGAWLFVEGNQDELSTVPMPGRPITLLIGEDAAEGESGCNGYYFPLLIDGDSLTWDESRPATSTELMCLDDDGNPETALAELERWYLDNLHKVDRFAVDGDVLILLGPDLELRFSREPAAGG